MCQYTYNGPVMEFNTCIAHRWEASTFAVSENKARSNLMYQYKIKYNKPPNTKITLPGKMVAIA